MKVYVFALILLATCLGVYGLGIPMRNCPPGEHSVLYCPQMAEPSCDNPKLHDLDGPAACDIPDCFCDAPNVRDLTTNDCIPLSECP